MVSNLKTTAIIFLQKEKEAAALKAPEVLSSFCFWEQGTVPNWPYPNHTQLSSTQPLNRISLKTSKSWYIMVSSIKSIGANPISVNISYIHVNTWECEIGYRGWKKSCITLGGWNPKNNGRNHLSTGAGFLLSTVLQCLQQQIPGFVAWNALPDLASPHCRDLKACRGICSWFKERI